MKHLILVLLLCCRFLWLPADTISTSYSSSSYNFKSLNTSFLLPTNEVRNLYQDKEGYIWISTYNGLLRYDGYSTVEYRSSASDDYSRYIDGFVNIVCEDHAHRLWIGTHNGLFCLDKKTERMERIVSSGLHASFIEAVECSAKGDVWVGTGQGVFRKKAEEDEFRRQFPSVPMDVKSIMEDHSGQVWIGTWNQGLFRYDPRQDKLYKYPDINPFGSAHILFQDKEHRIWIGTWRYGLMQIVNPYDMEHYSFLSFRHDESDPQSLADDIVYAIAQDNSTGNIWVGTRSALSVLDVEKKSFINCYPKADGRSLPSGEVDALLCSQDGLMWVGMLGGGVCTANIRQKQFGYDGLDNIRKYNLSSSVRSIFQDREGILWLGIMGFGFVQYDLKSKTFISFHDIPAFSQLPYISVVNEMVARRSTGDYCLATWDDGVWMYDGKKVRVIDDKTYPNLTDVCIYSLLEDHKGDLWLGSRSGVFLFDRHDRLYSLNDMLAPGEKRFPDVSVFKICEDREGNIWLATSTLGVCKLIKSEEGYRVRKYAAMFDNADMLGAMTLCIDSHNRIWAGTNGNGLNLYDEEKDCFVTVWSDYFEKNEAIYSILEDNDQGIWLTSNFRMYHIVCPASGGNWKLHTYTVEDGLQDYIFNRNACYKGNDGTLYFGGVKGINVFSPKEIVYDKYSYPVVITDLKINNMSIRDEAFSCEGISASLDFLNHITLDYTQNDFSFDFSILNYINPQQNKYEFQLEGYDKKWNPVGADRRFAYYRNLPAGDYRFKVRGANANGIWSEHIKTMNITILPPPWLTWWAYVLYVLFFVLLLFLIYRVMTKRLHLQQMVELANLQRQKFEEINHSKLQFFTNITHELLTPLTIISVSVEEIKAHIPAARGHIQEIEENSQRLIRLIQQILEFRKFENNKQQLRVSYGNLSAFLLHSCQAFAPLVRKKSLHFCFVNKESQYEGFFDSDKLDKILYNLLSNAAKYTVDGGCITLDQWYDAESKCFCFSVNNPGEVIPEEKMANMFERFYEGDYRKFHTTGTGIGLSLTRDLVRLHHGTIRVESDIEKGITFIVSLPVDKSAFTADEVDEKADETDSVIGEVEYDAEVVEDTEKPVLSVEPAVNEASLPLVLLVEDNDDLRAVERRVLSAYFQVIDVSSAELALDELKQHKVDIVVSDVMMEGMNGFDLCKSIKHDFETRHIPVILITARTADNDRVEGYESGADGYICKPIHMKVLVAKIFNLLKKSGEVAVDSRKQLVFEAKEVDYTAHDELFLKKVVDCVNMHLDDMEFDVITLVDEVGMSRTAFTEKMKKLTGMTPLAFVSSIRLQAAYRLLQEKKKMRITDLAYAVGFNDPKYFSQCFKKKFGFSPKEYQSNQP